MAAAPSKPPKKKFSFPTAFTILFLLLVLIALATWIIPAGTYDYNADGEPIPGTYHQVPANPQKLLTSALKGPINGMYGIEDASGNVDVWNSGELFGAIDVAMFVLIIGGFLGVTMKTGAINAGIAFVVSKLKGKEKWMFPILMTIFAIGGTTYGMAEETLAFYALIITVMLAAGYDGLSAGSPDPAGRRDRRAGLHRQPLCHRHRLGFRRDDHQRRADRAAGAAGGRHGHRHLLRDALRRKGQERSDQVADLRPESRK